MFISFEGGDGSGKSTQARLLTDTLTTRGIPALLTHEPGGSPNLGPKVREILLHGEEISFRAEALLYAAERAEHVDKVVRPALAAGTVVITDRYVDSSLAYQGAGRGLPLDDVLGLSMFATDGLMPDLVVVCDVDEHVAAARRDLRAAPDRMERANMARAVRQLLLDRASADPTRYAVVDGSGTPEAVAAVITSLVLERIV